LKKLISALMGTLMVFAVIAEADAKSRSGGGFSSSRSSFSSRSFSKPKQKAVVSKPVVRSTPKQVAPRAATTKPVAKQSVVVSKPMAKPVSASTSFKRTPVRKVTSPIAARKTVIIQKNYYGSRYSGYNNRSYNTFGGGYGSSYGGGSGFGSSLVGGALGAFGGMWFYNALNSDEPQEPSVFEETLEEPQAQIEPNPYEPTDNFTVDGTLPNDAPLMMNPNYYQQ